jgi:hypothetical protein
LLNLQEEYGLKKEFKKGVYETVIRREAQLEYSNRNEYARRPGTTIFLNP